MNNIKVLSYNCQSIKSSKTYVSGHCDDIDICILQEHWLYKSELSLLNNIHRDFIACGTSPNDCENGLLRGRPYGSLAFL